MINFYSMLRLVGSGLKYLGILLLPLVFPPDDLALIAIMLGMERFISFLFSLEAHGLFNREIIQQTSNHIIINSDHLVFLFLGAVVALCFAVVYSLFQDLLSIFLPIVAVGLSSGLLNELTRKAQASSAIDVFSILSFLKSTIFVLSIGMFLIFERHNYLAFSLIWACISVASIFLSFTVYGHFFECDPSRIRQSFGDFPYIKSRLISLRHFVVLGAIMFGLVLFERTIIFNFYEPELLANYFVIQALVVASLALYDVLLWGPWYPKIVADARAERNFMATLTDLRSSLVKALSLVVSALVAALTTAAVLSSQYQAMITHHTDWLLILSSLLLVVPVDTLLTYYCHGRRLDRYNAWAASIGFLCMAAFLFLNVQLAFVPLGYIGFYVVSMSCKLVFLSNDRILM